MPRRASLPSIAAVLAVVTTAVGVTVHETTGRLGTATPPFVAVFGLAVHPLALVAVVVAAGVVALGPRLLEAPGRPAAFAATAFALALALGLAVNAARHGTSGWSEVFDTGPGGSFEAKNEYLPSLTALSYGTHFFLDRFDLLVPSLTPNGAGHPPGLLLALHLLGVGTAGAMAALCIAAAALLAPLAYLLGSTLAGDERRARTAALLAAASPATILFGVTSADAIFAAAGTATACLLVARPAPVRALGAVALAGAALLSYALLAIGAFAALVAWRRDGARAALVLAAGCAVALVALNGGLALVYGYDPLAALQATNDAYRDSVASRRPHWFWVAGSPVAWGVLLGLPIAAGWLAAVERRAAPALALAAVVGVAAILGFTKAETERIWLPFVPLACVAAAELVPAARLRVVLGMLAAQALVTELLFSTIW